MEQTPPAYPKPLVSTKILSQEFRPDFTSETEDPLFGSAVRQVVGEEGKISPEQLPTALAVYQELHRARLAIVDTDDFGLANIGQIVDFFNARIQQLIEHPDTPLQ